METGQGCWNQFTSRQGADEDPQQQHGGNAMVLQAGQEGGEVGPVQGGLDQGIPAQRELAPGNRAQEEPAQSTPAQEATAVLEEVEHQEDNMSGGHADADGPEPMDIGDPEEGTSSSTGRQQQPMQEEAISECTQSILAACMSWLPSHGRTRFTHNQLMRLESLFQETHYPTLHARKELARCLGVTEIDVQNWFRIRRAIMRRNNRASMASVMPSDSTKEDP